MLPAVLNSFFNFVVIMTFSVCCTIAHR